ncbi:regulator of MON1-CCZ1 complex isoform X2 [Condylostylus longicornis]|nr:regulator of MON1-CCZ1 complex isoform X2 [Condylostylus longicornis]
MDDKGPIRSIKFSPDNKILAVQRKENLVEFICFRDGQPQPNEIIQYNSKYVIYGFFWVHNRDVAIVSENGIQIFTTNIEKKQMKLIKSSPMPVKWFTWCSEGNLALLSCEGNNIYPVRIKQKVIEKLPKLDLETNREIPEREVTLGQIYGKLAVLILQQNSNRLLEVLVYLLDGPGLAPRKSHVLRLGHGGRFAMNVVDNLIIVHHQASATSMLFDINLKGEDINDVTYHAPVTPGRTIKPFSLKLPSLSPDGQTMDCELYSINWVVFQPNVVIDAKLGCMWYLSLQMDSLCNLITDRVRLIEFLLQRVHGEVVILRVLKQLVDENYNGTLLPTLENIFDKINKFYKDWLIIQMHNQTALPSSQKNLPKLPTLPRVVIDQTEMQNRVFASISEKPHAEKVLLLYINSLNKHEIIAEENLSKMIVSELIRNNHYGTLQRLVDYSLIMESKPIACFLLSHSNVHPIITQTALDMLKKINATEFILEVLLEQGKIVDALKILKSLPGNSAETIPARKYLEAAKSTKDPLVFYATFKYFQQRNLKLRENIEPLNNYVQHFNKLFPSQQ